MRADAGMAEATVVTVEVGAEAVTVTVRFLNHTVAKCMPFDI